MEVFASEVHAWTPTEIARLLKSQGGLAELSPENALRIVALMRPESVAAGTVLIEEGVTHTGFMAMVLEGEAIVQNSVPGASEAMVLGELGPGALFGELGVLDSKPRSATVTAVTDMLVAVLDRAAMRRLVETLPGVACELLSAIVVRVSERLRATNRRLQELTEENGALRQQLARRA